MPAKVWLITGASSGIGLSLAQYVLLQGDHVVATVRSLSKLPDTLRDAGAKALVLDLNACDADIRRAGEEALKVYGHIDVLVNNAAYGVVAPVEELKQVYHAVLDDMRAQFQTNVFGAIALVQALLPSFRARRSGQIFNVSSVCGLSGFSSWGAYCASKAALELFSDALSQEVAPFGIRVLIIEPGYFSTNFFQTAPLFSHDSDSKVYTDPSQGYRTLEEVPKQHVRDGQIGDVVKLSARIYEVVHGVGMAQGLREWLRVPLGTDSGERLRWKINTIQENVDAFEQIWRSTDVEPDRLKFYPRG
ncbi:NAD(P)-binding protein [Laetiporus sulphureus 93-53]|uniref:NAD(P)-binding protein n=1 Tax=Laetiporus sulphureus 93-53 TaxID=1314785 RepID=A0A165CHE8_9APHY|nr:NAD(P)-binding protein [Laetiporus sulphureus 93-53]KZT02818.1 NAD(P)-binding protein [Laetiporus sulphureus 93-53]